MKVARTCPYCNYRMSVSVESIGQEVICPKCGEQLPGLEDAESQHSATPSVLPLVFWFFITCFFVSAVMFAVAASSTSRKAEEMRAERLGTTVAALERAERASTPSQDVGAVFLGLGMLFWFVILFIGYVVAIILILAWVARDSRSRGVDGGAVWVIVIFLTGVIGLLVYLASRPYGILITCSRCNNKKLNYAKICPHCGQRSR
jgi:hypothetical protein